MQDDAFDYSEQGLALALALLAEPGNHGAPDWSDRLPERGVGEMQTLRTLAPLVVGEAAVLGGRDAFAHMDPPTPWITWALAQWNAALNQNLLHPATAPVARDIERRVIDWLSPLFGMDGGHMTPGSTVANLTALWAARETAGVRRVVASDSSHLSIAKAANLLGLDYINVATDERHRLRRDQLPDDLRDSCVVLNAGSTGSGAVDGLDPLDAAWLHVDAAWGGALRLSTRHAASLDGIQRADSVSVSAHKWLFQPKESAIVLFRDSATAQRGISFGGDYLEAANVGVLGSHGAGATTLLATLLAWGREGMAERIDRCMALAAQLYEFVDRHDMLVPLAPPQTGIVVWRHRDPAATDALFGRLPSGSTSRLQHDGHNWLRNVAANPNADVTGLCERIGEALRQ